MLTTLSIIGVLLILFIIRILIENNKVPVLGVSNGKFKPVSQKPNNVTTQTENPKKKVAPLIFKEDRESTILALKQAIGVLGGGEIIAEEPDYLYVIFTSSLMKYRDDLEFWLDEKNGEVHYRSSSRAGFSDMGVNRKRYNAISKLYQTA